MSSQTHPVHSPDMGIIAPQSTTNTTTTTDRRRNSQTTSKFKGKFLPSNIQSICHLSPGHTHQIELTPSPLPTARGLIDGSYHASLHSHSLSDNKRHLDVFTLFPRIPEHSGQSGVPSIVFCVGGRPGPYLHKLERVVLDAPDVSVFDGFGWRRTTLVLDWPGVRTEKHYLSCTPDSSFHTRQQVAREVGRRIVSFISYSRKPTRARQFAFADQHQQLATDPRWDIRTIDIRDVRLLGLNYYNSAWVPVLALALDVGVGDAVGDD